MIWIQQTKVLKNQIAEWWCDHDSNSGQKSKFENSTQVIFPVKKDECSLMGFLWLAIDGAGSNMMDVWALFMEFKFNQCIPPSSRSWPKDAFINAIIHFCNVWAFVINDHVGKSFGDLVINAFEFFILDSHLGAHWKGFSLFPGASNAFLATSIIQ